MRLASASKFVCLIVGKWWSREQRCVLFLVVVSRTTHESDAGNGWLRSRSPAIVATCLIWDTRVRGKGL